MVGRAARSRDVDPRRTRRLQAADRARGGRDARARARRRLPLLDAAFFDLR